MATENQGSGPENTLAGGGSPANAEADPKQARAAAQNEAGGEDEQENAQANGEGADGAGDAGSDAGEGEKSGEPDAEKAGKGEDEGKSQRPPSRAKTRIEQLSREKRELADENRRLQEQVRKQAEANDKLKGEKPPKLEDFETEGEYHAAIARHAARAARAEERQDDLTQRQDDLRSREQQARDARNEAWQEGIPDAVKRMPDFYQVFDDRVPVTDVMADVMAESDVGYELAYFLGKNRHEAHRIARLPPIEAARELGRLEARVSPPKPKRISTAPKPPKQVSGKSHQAQRPIAEESYEDFKRRRMAMET